MSQTVTKIKSRIKSVSGAYKVTSRAVFLVAAARRDDRGGRNQRRANCRHLCHLVFLSLVRFHEITFRTDRRASTAESRWNA